MIFICIASWVNSDPVALNPVISLACQAEHLKAIQASTTSKALGVTDCLCCEIGICYVVEHASAVWSSTATCALERLASMIGRSCTKPKSGGPVLPHRF